MALIISYAKYKEYLADKSMWPETTYSQEIELDIDHNVYQLENLEFEDIPDDALVLRVNGTVFTDNGGLEVSAWEHFKKWWFAVPGGRAEWRNVRVPRQPKRRLIVISPDDDELCERLKEMIHEAGAKVVSDQLQTAKAV